MSLSHTPLIKRLRLFTLVLGVVLFALIMMAAARQAHAATYVPSGTITLCHDGTNATNTWDTLAVNASVPTGTSVTFKVQTATSCTAVPGAFSGTTWTVSNNSTVAQSLSPTPASKSLFIQITLTSDSAHTSTPVLNSATLVDTPVSVNDTTNPTTVLASPGTGTLSGIVTLSATATDPGTPSTGVSKVDFRQSTGACSASSTLIGTDTTSPYSVPWDTTGLTAGTYNICSVATDGAGNVSVPSSATVSVNNTGPQDTTPPTSVLTSPGTTVTGASVALNATASDSGTPTSGVAKVDFREVTSTGTCSTTSALIGSDTTSPYSTTWDTTTLADGSYKVCSIATDVASNVQTTPSTQTVTVSNSTTTSIVNFTTPTNGATVAKGSVTLTAHTQFFTPAATGVTFKDGSTTIGSSSTSVADPSGNGRDWSVTWNTSGLTAGSSHTLVAVGTNGTTSTNSPAITVTIQGTVTDTQPPTTPTNLSATASSATDVHLTWTASTDNVGVTGYHIFRNGSPTALATVGASTVTYDDTTVQPTTNYSYTVQAFDAVPNNSQLSNSASVTTPCAGDCVAPSAPTNVTGSASTVGSPATSVKVSLSWTASTDNVGVSSYTVLRDGSAVATGVVGTSFTDTTVQPNTSYTYTVVAKDAAGNTSATSNGFTVKTPVLPDTQAPTVPQNVAATAITPTQVNVTWSASTDNVGVVSYIVLRNGAQVGTSTGTSFGDGSVTANSTYSYTVKANDAAGNTSTASAAATVTTPQATTTTTPVYRLYQSSTGDHFYTTSTIEVQFAENIPAPYVLEKVAFNAYADNAHGVPVYRMYQPSSGHHFYTTSQSEVSFALSIAQPFILENPDAFNEDSASSSSNTAVFRLYQASSGDHFYTNSQADVTAVEGFVNPYVLETTGWYAPN